MKSANCSLVMLLAACGCAQPHPVVVSAPVSHAPRMPDEVMVGIDRVDVTPAPGVSTFGHAPDAMVTDGYWSRLYCRAFVFKPASDMPLAIVPCDLAAVSAALHHRVADKVKGILPRSRLMMTATHTHAGPAHYFESEAYGGVASSRLPGFDEAMLEMLASRIAAGIERAYNRLRPARMRWVHTEAWKLTRNRSLAAFYSNAQNFAEQHPSHSGEPLSEEERAIDPALDVLQIEETTPVTHKPLGPLGWLVFYAMHPTALPATNQLLGADIFGATSRVLEAKLRPLRALNDTRCSSESPGRLRCPPKTQDFDPLVGVINTNEGDASPIWSVGNTEEAMNVGTKLADRAFVTYQHPSKFNDRVILESRYIEADLPGACLIHGGSLCAKGELGMGTGHGGSDHPASTDALFPRAPDLDNGREHCQAPKAEMMGVFQGILLGRGNDRFPEHVSFGLVHLDDTWLSFVPGELTVHAGWAVRRRVEGIVQSKSRAREHYVIAGLANAYVQYIATREEYNLQRYEGASTLYGPSSAEYFAERLEILARSMAGQDGDKWIAKGQPPIDAAVTVPFDFAVSRERLARAEGPELTRVERRGAVDLCSVRLSLSRPAICFYWRDGSPGRTTVSNPMGEPWVELESDDTRAPLPNCILSGSSLQCDPVTNIDDRGLEFQTRVHRRLGNGYLWSTLFRPGDGQWQYLKQLGKIRIRVRGDAQSSHVESPAFGISDLPPCSNAVATECNGT